MELITYHAEGEVPDEELEELGQYLFSSASIEELGRRVHEIITKFQGAASGHDGNAGEVM